MVGRILWIRSGMSKEMYEFQNFSSFLYTEILINEKENN